ncbi:hypothetical protein HAX54_004618 [Datura stramonium]|uniref:Uncharacterized protein n=1 Tax=Datura stramonium TaxID=4076 RepID=A0ABS8T8C4_DATST|nr:hypothetical protein [Datura stramonium]
MCMRGSHLVCQGAYQGFRHPRDENKDCNCENIAKLRSWESDKSSHSKIEGMLEMVLERVLSTDLGIHELKNDLLELTWMVKDHDISIRHLEERMNHLASQMRLEMRVKEKEQLMVNFTPSSKDVDEEDIEKNIEEKLFNESLEAILLNNIGKNSEELEEASHSIKDEILYDIHYGLFVPHDRYMGILLA